MPFVPVGVKHGALIADHNTYAPAAAESRSTQELHSPLSVSVERSCRPCIRCCGTGGFQGHGQCFFIGLRSSLPCGTRSLYCETNVFQLIGCKLLSPSLALQTFFNNYNKELFTDLLLNIVTQSIFTFLWRLEVEILMKHVNT